MDNCWGSTDKRYLQKLLNMADCLLQAACLSWDLEHVGRKNLHHFRVMKSNKFSGLICQKGKQKKGRFNESMRFEPQLVGRYLFNIRAE